jgi:hypothetical protein
MYLKEGKEQGTKNYMRKLLLLLRSTNHYAFSSNGDYLLDE